MKVKEKRKKKTVLNVKNMNEDCRMMEDKRNNQNLWITANIVQYICRIPEIGIAPTLSIFASAERRV
jgi:hypothetical protein